MDPMQRVISTLQPFMPHSMLVRLACRFCSRSSKASQKAMHTPRSSPCQCQWPILVRMRPRHRSNLIHCLLCPLAVLLARHTSAASRPLSHAGQPLNCIAVNTVEIRPFMTFDILAQGYLPLEAKQSLSKDMCTWHRQSFWAFPLVCQFMFVIHENTAQARVRTWLDSRCSSVSPMHAMTFRLCANAFAAFAPTKSLLSFSRLLRSEWPRMTHGTFISASCSGAICRTACKARTLASKLHAVCLVSRSHA